MIQAFLIKLIVRKLTVETIKRLLKKKRVIAGIVLLVTTALGLALPAEVTDAIILIVSAATEAQ